MTRAFPRDEVFLIVFLWAVFLCLTSSATEAELINAVHPHVGWRPLNMHWSNQNLRARHLFIIFSRDTVWRTVFVSCFSRCFHFYLFWSFFKRSSIHNSVGTERSLSGRRVRLSIFGPGKIPLSAWAEKVNDSRGDLFREQLGLLDVVRLFCLNHFFCLSDIQYSAIVCSLAIFSAFL